MNIFPKRQSLTVFFAADIRLSQVSKLVRDQIGANICRDL